MSKDRKASTTKMTRITKTDSKTKKGQTNWAALIAEEKKRQKNTKNWLATLAKAVKPEYPASGIVPR